MSESTAGPGRHSMPEVQEGGQLDDERPLTYDELMEVSLLINKVTGPHLIKIIDIIRRMQPSQTQDGDEFVIDFDVLEPVTVRAIKHYVKTLTFYQPST